jgi:CBS domain-containing protein
MNARELMSSFPAVATPGDDLWVAARLMREHEVGFIPIVDDRETMHLVGVITDRDIAVRCVGERHFGTCKVRDHMTPRPLVTVHPEESVDVVLEHMDRARVRRLPVVDDAEHAIGVIAQADVIRKLRVEEPLVVEVIRHVSQPA